MQHMSENFFATFGCEPLPQAKSRQAAQDSTQDNTQDPFASLFSTLNLPQRATHRGKGITLPRTAMEQRIYISKSTRQLRYATYTDKPIRDGYTKSKVRSYNAVGAASLSANDIRYLAQRSNYNMRVFRRLLKAKLGREVCVSEAVEFIDAAAKYRTAQTFATTRKSVPKGVVVYAK